MTTTDQAEHEADAAPAPQAPRRAMTVEETVLADHPEWTNVLADAVKGGYADLAPWTDIHKQAADCVTINPAGQRQILDNVCVEAHAVARARQAVAEVAA